MNAARSMFFRVPSWRIWQPVGGRERVQSQAGGRLGWEPLGTNWEPRWEPTGNPNWEPGVSNWELGWEPGGNRWEPGAPTGNPAIAHALAHRMSHLRDLSRSAPPNRRRPRLATGDGTARMG